MGQKLSQRKVIKMIKAFLYTFIIFMVLLVGIGLLIRFTPLPEYWIKYYVLGALCIACLFLGLSAGNLIKRKGIIFGALVAIAFTILILATSTIITGFQSKEGIFQVRYILCYISGSIGGMIGVNL
jgi:putative membrane protein (TIGR04086 family)